MNPKSTIEAEKQFPYTSEPTINFFLYPPIKPMEHCSIEDKLGLEQDMPYTDLFTVYLSIPYCRRKCHSCQCFRELLPNVDDIEAFLDGYVECLVKQAKAYGQSKRYRNGQCASIFIGGGTASVLSTKQLRHLISSLMEAFHTDEKTEIVFEGNPIDFSSDYLQQVKEIGVTRLTIGYQSGNDTMLRALNTSHTAKVGIEAIKNAVKAGFGSVNVDLLYNIPGQTKEIWKQELEQVTALGPDCISPGDYVVFPGSNAEKLIQKGSLPPQHTIDVVNDWYHLTKQILESNGYYEHVRGIYSRSGHIQQYVTVSCNRSSEIVGIGAGAFGFVNGYQFKNVSDSAEYKAFLQADHFFPAEEISKQCTARNYMERYIIHNFYSEVVDRVDFKKRFGIDITKEFGEIIDRLESHGLISISEEKIGLTDIGKKWRRSIYYEFHAEEFKE